MCDDGCSPLLYVDRQLRPKLPAPQAKIDLLLRELGDEIGRGVADERYGLEQ
jgi:hypothetical protein